MIHHSRVYLSESNIGFTFGEPKENPKLQNV